MTWYFAVIVSRLSPGLTPAPPRPAWLQAPLWSCVAILTNTMLGAGVLGMPHGLAQMGWLQGSLTLVLSAFFRCARSRPGDGSTPTRP
jgi:hypothetical protein